MFVSACFLAVALAPAQTPPAASRPTAPVTIFAGGNRLVVQCDDPETLAIAQAAINMMIHPSNGRAMHVLKLQYAKATDAARMLDEVFGDPRSRAAQGARDPDGIRIVADPATNSLLIRATTLEYLDIRRLIEQSIDISNSDSKALSRTWFVGPFQQTTAANVAQVVRQLYPDSSGGGERAERGTGRYPGMDGAFPGNGIMLTDLDPEQAGGAGQAFAPRSRAKLSLSVDERSNRLVLYCSEKVYQEVKALGEQLEQAARDSPKTLLLVQIKGVDPCVVQQAFDTLQGRRTAQPRSTDNSSSNGPGLNQFPGIPGLNSMFPRMPGVTPPGGGQPPGPG